MALMMRSPCQFPPYVTKLWKKQEKGFLCSLRGPIRQQKMMSLGRAMSWPPEEKSRVEALSWLKAALANAAARKVITLSLFGKKSALVRSIGMRMRRELNPLSETR